MLQFFVPSLSEDLPATQEYAEFPTQVGSGSGLRGDAGDVGKLVALRSEKTGGTFGNQALNADGVAGRFD